MKLKEEYEKIVATQNESGIIEKVSDGTTSNLVFYMPHKPVIREDAATTIEDRGAFGFLFKVNGQEEHFRFTRVPFGAEASPFILGATVNITTTNNQKRSEKQCKHCEKHLCG